MAFIETFEMLLHLIWKIIYFFLPIPSQYESLVFEHRGVSRDQTPGLSASSQPPLNIPRNRSSTPRPVRARRTCRHATVQVVRVQVADRDFSSERGSSISLSPRHWSPSPTPNINPEDPYFYVSYETDSDSDTELLDEQEVASNLLGITTRVVPLPVNQEETEDAALLVAENQKNSAYLRNGDGIITFSLGLGRKLLDSLGLPSRRLVSLPHFKNLTSEGWTLGKHPDADTTLNEETQPFAMRLKLAGTWDAAENNKVAIGFRTFLVDTLLPQMATHAEVDLTINEVDDFRFDHCRLHPWNQRAQLAESHTESFVLDGPAPYLHEILTFAPTNWTRDITNLKLLHHSIPVSTLRAVLTSFPALDDLIVDRIAEIPYKDLGSLPESGKSLRSPKKMFIASGVVLWSFLSVLEIQPHGHGRDIRLDLSRAQNMGNLVVMSTAPSRLAGLEIMLPPNVLPRHFSRQLAMNGWGATPGIGEGGQGYITLGTKRIIINK